MMRKSVSRLLGATVGGANCCSGAGGTGADAATEANVLVIVADNIGYGDIGVDGGREAGIDKSCNASDVGKIN